MEYHILASGSKGNATIIKTKTTTLLLDCGCSKTYIVNQLKLLEININEIQALLMTHSHSDHIKGLSSFNHVPLYASFEVKGRHDEKLVVPYEKFKIGDIEILPIKLSHDAQEIVGYVFSCDEKLVYITDTGFVSGKNISLIQNAEYYIFEANHDIDMLMETNRPAFLKARIISDVGHLSNETAGTILSEVIGTNTKEISLAHLSSEANTPELAKSTVEDVLNSNGIPTRDLLIRCAPQFAITSGGHL